MYSIIRYFSCIQREVWRCKVELLFIKSRLKEELKGDGEQSRNQGLKWVETPFVLTALGFGNLLRNVFCNIYILEILFWGSLVLSNFKTSHSIINFNTFNWFFLVEPTKTVGIPSLQFQKSISNKMNTSQPTLDFHLHIPSRNHLKTHML